LPQSLASNFGDAGDRIRIPKTLPQNQPVKDDLWKAKVEWDLVWIQIVERNYDGACERRPVHRNRIGEVHDVGLNF
jgi:hypothetical protein